MTTEDNLIYPAFTDSAQELPVETVRVVGAAEETAELFHSLAKAAGKFEEIHKSKEGQIGHQKFKYASLDALVKATRPALAAEGVIVFQFLSGVTDEGKHRETMWVSKGNARIESVLEFEPEGDLKEYGKQTTYLRRYTYQALFQLDGSPDADDDGQAALRTGAGRRGPPGRSGPPAADSGGPASQQRRAAAPPRDEAPQRRQGPPVAARQEPPDPHFDYPDEPDPFDYPAPPDEAPPYVDKGAAVRAKERAQSEASEALVARVRPPSAPPPAVVKEAGPIPEKLILEFTGLLKTLGLTGPAGAAWIDEKVHKAGKDLTASDVEYLLQEAKREANGGAA